MSDVPARLGRIGVWTAALDALPLAEACDAVAELDALGYGSMWFSEAFGREAFTAAALYLAASERMLVGTGIANIFGRDAMTTVGAANTLAAAHPGRFVLGLGVSHPPLVEGMRGHHYGRPVAAMRAYLDAIDSAPHLVGGELTPPPRLIAALGPKMLELARDAADGAHPYLVTPEHTAAAREVLGPETLLVVEQAAVIDDDEDTWRRRAHWHLEVYTGLENYRASWRRQGFDDDDLVTGGTERLKRAMVARGLKGTGVAVQAHLDAGATTVVVQVLGEDAATAQRDDWRRLAEALL